MKADVYHKVQTLDVPQLNKPGKLTPAPSRAAYNAVAAKLWDVSAEMVHLTDAVPAKV